jgi:farnesyl diphosphate synthase
MMAVSMNNVCLNEPNQDNEEVFDAYRLRLNTRLRELIESADIPAERIVEAMIYSVFPGGKRIRPLLVYLCGNLVGVDIQILDIIAAAIELTHCYSLVHDDLPAMDNDDFRRGRPSCHRAFDEATAILVGDGLQVFVIDILLTDLPRFLSPHQVIAVTQALVKACGPSGMISGQSLDLSELNHSVVTEEKLRQIHHLKTGKLMSACISMVLASGTPSAMTSHALEEFSRHLGLVFQMQDDYLDQYGNGESLGKGRASDEANDKTTFATLYSKDDLFSMITHYFQHARAELMHFGVEAAPLHALINTLENRTMTI